MLLIVGLGNPGKEYAANRHNVGMMAVEALARRLRAESFREKFAGQYARCEIDGEPAVLLQPMTYMNESGRSVQPAMAFFKVATNDVIVLHDELDLPFGDVRLKFGGGHAGHNGIRSVIASLSTPDFGRVRIGIGRPPAEFRGEVHDFVLANFDAMERTNLPDVLERASGAVTDIAKRGFNAAMNARNTRPKPSKPPKAPEKPSSEPAESPKKNTNPGEE